MLFVHVADAFLRLALLDCLGPLLARPGFECQTDASEFSELRERVLSCVATLLSEKQATLDRPDVADDECRATGLSQSAHSAASNDSFTSDMSYSFK